MPPTPISLTAGDATSLAATLFTPDDGEPRAVVVVGGAMGTTRRFYRRFAHYLAERGFAVLTYDYRGIGDSTLTPTAFRQATLQDWGRLDIPAALDYCAGRWPTLPLSYVTHSVSGQLLGLVPEIERVHRVVMVGSQTGHWRYWPLPHRIGLFFFWYAALPMATKLYRRFPAGLFGMGAPLPPRVALEWARWGRHPDYLVGVLGEATRARYAALALDILAYDVTDDPFAPPRAVDKLMEYYAAARITRRQLTPGNLGRRRIGHFAFFREELRSLWPDVAGWLDADAQPAGPRLSR